MVSLSHRAVRTCQALVGGYPGWFGAVTVPTGWAAGLAVPAVLQLDDPAARERAKLNESGGGRARLGKIAADAR